MIKVPAGRMADDALQHELRALPDMQRGALVKRWCELYGSPPPRYSSKRLMRLAIAYRLQEQALGKLKGATRRKLEQAAKAVDDGRSPARVSMPSVKPGTRLLREWQGVMHEVIVLEDGVEYGGRTWRSLSAVAREITGTRWSGPVFFGLKSRGHQNG